MVPLVAETARRHRHRPSSYCGVGAQPPHPSSSGHQSGSSGFAPAPCENDTKGASYNEYLSAYVLRTGCSGRVEKEAWMQIIWKSKQHVCTPVCVALGTRIVGVKTHQNRDLTLCGHEREKEMREREKGDATPIPVVLVRHCTRS